MMLNVVSCCVGWLVVKWLWRPNHSYSQADSSSYARQQTSSDGRLQRHSSFVRCPKDGCEYWLWMKINSLVC